MVIGQGSEQIEISVREIMQVDSPEIDAGLLGGAVRAFEALAIA